MNKIKYEANKIRTNSRDIFFVYKKNNVVPTQFKSFWSLIVYDYSVKIYTMTHRFPIQYIDKDNR